MEHIESFSIFLVVKSTPSKSQRPGVKSHCLKAFLWGAEAVKPGAAVS
jgi:hypothetical protein